MKTIRPKASFLQLANFLSTKYLPSYVYFEETKTEKEAVNGQIKNYISVCFKDFFDIILFMVHTFWAVASSLSAGNVSQLPHPYPSPILSSANCSSPNLELPSNIFFILTLRLEDVYALL